jgi:hypothetical protein
VPRRQLRRAPTWQNQKARRPTKKCRLSTATERRHRRERHPFCHQYRAGASQSRVVMSTGTPKKATPERTPTFSPVLLTTLAPCEPAALFLTLELGIASLVASGRVGLIPVAQMMLRRRRHRGYTADRSYDTYSI